MLEENKKESKYLKSLNSFFDSIEKQLFNNSTFIIRIYYLIVIVFFSLSFFFGLHLPKYMHLLILGLMYGYILISINSINEQIKKMIIKYGFLVSSFLLVVTKDVFLDSIVAILSVSLSTIFIQKINQIIAQLTERDNNLDYSEIRDRLYGFYFIQRLRFFIIFSYFGGVYLLSKFIINRVWDLF